jgi:hypothetical protein
MYKLFIEKQLPALHSKTFELFLLESADFSEKIGIFIFTVIIKLAGVCWSFGDDLDGRWQLACHEVVPVEALNNSQT